MMSNPNEAVLQNLPGMKVLCPFKFVPSEEYPHIPVAGELTNGFAFPGIFEVREIKDSNYLIYRIMSPDSKEFPTGPMPLIPVAYPLQKIIEYIPMKILAPERIEPSLFFEHSEKTRGTFALMGKLKMLQPFKFPEWGKWGDTFDMHGIFEILGKQANPKDPGNPLCTIRRIATARLDCPLGQTTEFSEKLLVEVLKIVPVSKEAFDQK